MAFLDPNQRTTFFGAFNAYHDRITLSGTNLKTPIKLKCFNPSLLSKIFRKLDAINFFNSETGKNERAYVKPPSERPSLSLDPFPNLKELDWDHPPIPLPASSCLVKYKKKNSDDCLRKLNYHFDIFRQLEPYTKELIKYSKASRQIVVSKLLIAGKDRKLFVDVNENGFGCILALEKLNSGAFKKVFKGIDSIKHKIVAFALSDLRREEYGQGRVSDMRLRISIEEHLIFDRIKNIPGMIKVHYISYFYMDKTEKDTTNSVPCQAMVMKWCNQGELLECLMKHLKAQPADKYTPVQILRMAFVAASTIERLHTEGILHRDIKLENFLLHLSKKNILKLYLCDFGFACFENNIPKGNCGSPIYLAPEIMETTIYKSSKNPFSKASDIYAFGICLWGLLLGEFPRLNNALSDLNYFNPIDAKIKIKTIYTQIKQEEDPLPLSPAGDPLKYLLDWTTRFDPNERPTASQIVRYIEQYENSLLVALSSPPKQKPIQKIPPVTSTQSVLSTVLTTIIRED